MAANPVVRSIILAAVATCTALPQWQHFGVQTQNAFVAAHNAVRAKVGVGPLAWSDTLAAAAQEWANKLIASGQFNHSHTPNYGENLYEITGAAASPETVITAWAGEVKDYNYSSNTCHGVCGHYTQIVWADTKSVGCAVARKGRREVWVCEYGPPGNYIGQKPY